MPHCSPMNFGSPLWLLLLIPLTIDSVRRIRGRSQMGIIFSDVSLLKSAPKSLFLRLRQLVSLFPFAIFVLLILALARPRSGREDYRIEVEGIAIMMCIDRSGSMQAVDFKLDGRWMTRLDVVKKTFRDFVLGTDTLPSRMNDKIGLIAFGGFADAVCPLTLDHSTLVEMLNNVNLIAIPRDAAGNEIASSFINEERLTAIGDALVEAVARLKDVPAKSKVIILLSDGEQTAGIASPLDGALAARAYGIKIYTIGIGTTGTAAFVLKDRFGQDVITQQPVFLDQDTLVRVAGETGGHFFSAHDSQTLQDVYSQIDQLEKSAHEGRVYTRYNEHFRVFLWPAIALLVIYVLLISTRLQRVP